MKNNSTSDIKFDSPEEVMAQIDTMGYLLSNIDTQSVLTKKITFGLQCLMYMIGDNVKSMIIKLGGEAE